MSTSWQDGYDACMKDTEAQEKRHLALFEHTRKYSWNDRKVHQPDPDDVVFVMVTKDDTYTVGLASYTGIVFQDMNSKIIMGVDYWMRILPRNFQS